MWGIEGTVGAQQGMQQQMRPGDWNCVSCGDLQFARNSSCTTCCAPRPSSGAVDVWTGPALALAAAAATTAADSSSVYGAFQQSGGKGASSSPYGQLGAATGFSAVPLSAAVAPNWDNWGAGKPKSGDMPEIVWLSLKDTSILCQQGFPPSAPSFAFDKSKEIFSLSHHILMEFIPAGMDMKQIVEFHHDPDGDTFPDVYNAWKAAGQADNMLTVAACPSLAKWAVGFGGKAFGLRAAKLAMALSLATEADSTKLTEVCEHFPAFVTLLTAAGYDVVAAGVVPAPVMA